MWRLGQLGQDHPAGPAGEAPWESEARGAIIDRVSADVVEIAAIGIALDDASNQEKNTPERQKAAQDAAESLKQLVADTVEVDRAARERQQQLEAALRVAEEKATRLQARVSGAR